jgi:SAM-dependent methyltransferase
MRTTQPGSAAILRRSQKWDADTYDRRFGYVAALGTSALEWLDAQPGETVVDLGCGTGELTARIAEAGAHVLGIDNDAAMLDVARAKYPSLQFELADGAGFSTPTPVDAVFSNAALHWMTDADAVISAVWRVLRPGGRFVAEFGAGANVSALIGGLRQAVTDAGLVQPDLPWYFPTPAEHATRLEAGGLEIRRLEYFARPTPLTQGDTAADFWRMFGPSVLEQIPVDHVGDVLARTDKLLAPSLVGPDGRWIVDYARLRFIAVRPA